jgi:hypothetical protein
VKVHFIHDEGKTKELEYDVDIPALPEVGHQVLRGGILWRVTEVFFNLDKTPTQIDVHCDVSEDQE